MMTFLNQTFVQTETFKSDEVANNKFIRKVTDFFLKNPDPKHCMQDLSRLFKLMPLPEFKLEQSMVEEIKKSKEALSPLAALKRPPSNILLRKSLHNRQAQAQSPSRSRSRPASPSTITNEVIQLKVMKDKELRSQMTIREKLDNFKTNFCNSKF